MPLAWSPSSIVSSITPKSSPSRASPTASRKHRSEPANARINAEGPSHDRARQNQPLRHPAANPHHVDPPSKPSRCSSSSTSFETQSGAAMHSSFRKSTATNSVNTPSRILLIQTIHHSDHQKMPSTKRAAPTVDPDAVKYARIQTAANTSFNP